jgi:hypothetical protein
MIIGAARIVRIRMLLINGAELLDASEASPAFRRAKAFVVEEVRRIRGDSPLRACLPNAEQPAIVSASAGARRRPTQRGRGEGVAIR